MILPTAFKSHSIFIIVIIFNIILGIILIIILI